MKRLIQGVLTALLILLMAPGLGNTAGSSEGAELFQQHCAACHINGGNIIRRGKTLKLKALERQGITSIDAIAQIAREGVGQMSGACERVLSGCAGSRLAGGGGTPRPQWVGHGQGSSAKGDQDGKG